MNDTSNCTSRPFAARFSTVLVAASLLVIAISMRPASAALHEAAATQAVVEALPKPAIQGLWVWQPRYVSDLAGQDKMLAFCERQGFNRLLVQIPWKAGTAQIVHPKPGQEPTTGTALHPEISFPTGFARLIAEAAKRHIAVEALDGAPYMGDKIHWPETLATVDSIVAFNNSLPANARFAGIHWDIEPYVRPDWKVQATRVPIETEYLQLLTDAHQKLHDSHSNLTLSVDIPMWYDNKTAPDDNCIVTFNGQTKNFHMHIQDIVEYVGIMSYRQKATGTNSTFEMIANELAYAEKIGKFVCPAFETIQLKETPQITFFGQSKEKFQSEQHILEDALKDRPGYGGMFIHNYPSVCTILEPEVAVK